MCSIVKSYTGRRRQVLNRFQRCERARRYCDRQNKLWKALLFSSVLELSLFVRVTATPSVSCHCLLFLVMYTFGDCPEIVVCVSRQVVCSLGVVIFAFVGHFSLEIFRITLSII